MNALRPAWRAVLLGLVFVAPPVLKKVLLRVACGARIASSARIGWLSAVMGARIVLGEHSRIAPLTIIRCGGPVRIDAYAEVSSFVLAYGAAGLHLGRHSYIGPQSLVNADEDVVIGRLSALGPRSMVFTHGSYLPATEGYPTRLGGVTIGDRAWLAAGVFVHPGVRVGDDVFVNSRAVVTRDLPSGRVAEGSPATPGAPIERVKRRMTPARVDALLERILERFVRTELRGALGLVVEADGTRARFRYGWRSYVIACARSVDGDDAPARSEGDGARTILLSNDPRRAAARGDDPIVIDVVRLQTVAPRDAIHARVVHFVRQYYGIHLEFGPPFEQEALADRQAVIGARDQGEPVAT